MDVFFVVLCIFLLFLTNPLSFELENQQFYKVVFFDWALKTLSMVAGLESQSQTYISLPCSATNFKLTENVLQDTCAYNADAISQLTRKATCCAVLSRDWGRTRTGIRAKGQPYSSICICSLYIFLLSRVYASAIKHTIQFSQNISKIF